MTGNAIDNDPPLVSIVMPVRNRQKYVAETVDSIQRQTYTNWELLVIDDGSDDHTDVTINRLQQNDGRIRYQNNGVKRISGKLLNRGIEIARGTLIAFAEVGDIWHPDKLAKQVEAMKQYPEAAYCFTNGVDFRDEDKVVEAIYYKRQTGAISADFFKSICNDETNIRIQALMVWKRYMEGDNLFRTNRLITDFSFISNLARQFKGIIVYDVLLSHRLFPTHNMTTRAILYEEHVETISRYKTEQNLNPVTANKILFTAHISWGEEYLARNMKKEARKVFRQAWQYNKLNALPFKKILKSITTR